MNNQVIVDIENFLELMEPICVKYREVSYHDLLFVKGLRLPLVLRCESGKYPEEFISRVPFHPIIAAGLAKELILFGLTNESSRKLMLTNPLLKDCKVDMFIPDSKTTDSLIIDYFGIDIDHYDMEELLNISDQMLQYLEKFNIPGDRILDIDIEKSYIVINIGENIAHLRLKEAGYV